MDEWNTYYMQLFSFIWKYQTINPQTIEGSVFLEIYKLFILFNQYIKWRICGTDKWKMSLISCNKYSDKKGMF